MATIALQKSYPSDDSYHRGAVRVFKWETLTNSGSDVGAPIGPDFASYADRSVQVIGTFGTGGTVLIEGSLDGTNYATLTDPQGNALSIQSAKIEAISEATPYLRARISAGDGSTDLDVFVFLRQNRG